MSTILSYRRIKATEYNVVRLMMIITIWWQGCIAYKNPVRAYRVVARLIGNFKNMMGNNKLVRGFKSNGKYRWDIYNPAWPSKAFNRFFTNHLHELDPVSNKHFPLRRLLIAITKRCPLSCEHCSEAVTLYNKDVLTYEEFVTKINEFVNLGVGQLVYSGGEPLSRFDDLLKLLSYYRGSCDQWIYTSAFGLTLEKAILLKKSGLNGAAISLDHHIEEEHNRFRGDTKSFYWVMEGIKNLQKAGIFVSLNVCPTRNYIESGGMQSMITMAEKLNVPIVNILEPRAVGNYQDQDVELKEEHKTVLKYLSDRYNFDKNYFYSPGVMYPAAYRSAMSCGGGKSYLLLDYDGKLYPCPFCKVRMENVHTENTLCQAEKEVC